MKRTGFYFVGILIMTLGISLTIHSGLGTMPFDSLNVGLTNTFGLTPGTWEVINGGVLIVINAMLLRHRPDLLALLTAFITGVGIDFWLYLVLSSLPVHTFLSSFILLVTGIALVGAGVATYVKARFAYNPVDGFMFAIKQLTGFSLGASKAIVSLLLLVIAYFLNGPIGMGTVLAVILIGPIINYFQSVLDRTGGKMENSAKHGA
ncbi:YitT family protein [Pontibacillus salicampi]|uniref:YitT family protein n=1 Tax=Pontibacillus salicampi TaxID=1449801 RepID=A0ABV6LNK3_9BACI